MTFDYLKLFMYNICNKYKNQAFLEILNNIPLDNITVHVILEGVIDAKVTKSSSCFNYS